MSLKPTAHNFKPFVLNRPTKEEMILFCDALVANLIPGRESSELCSEIGSITGTFYCPDQGLCKRYGFNSEYDLEADIKEISEETGVPVNKIADVLHKNVGESALFGGFYLDTIVFVDLEVLRQVLDDLFNKSTKEDLS